MRETRMMSAKREAVQPFETRLHGQDLLAYLARRLREEREAQGLSMREVAVLTGLAQTTIWSIEQQKYWPHLRQMLHIAQVVQAPAVTLFPPDPDATLPADPRHPLCQIVALLRTCPREALDDLYHFLARTTPSVSPCPIAPPRMP